MDYFNDLLGVTSEQTLRFFFKCLQEEVTRKPVAQKETLYVASVLAHYAQTSRWDPNYMSPSGSLYDILDNFVLPAYTMERSLGLQDPEILEIAGSHTLLLVGFFRDQMNRKHNLSWYDKLGKSFFIRASTRVGKEEKAELLRGISENFVLWAVSCRNMSRTLRNQRYEIRLDS
jgi:hypothetical protein